MSPNVGLCYKSAMPALELNILAKNRSRSATPARLRDFDTREAGATETTQLLNDPTVTLYCLDDETGQAIFVQTPNEVDIYSHPFLYQAQYEHAQTLFALPYETLHQLARTLAEPKLVFLYSLGRSGSTLLSNAFGELDTVLSLSEPDVFFNLTGLRDVEGKRDTEFLELAKSCGKFLCKRSINKSPSTWLIKLRGFSIEIADILRGAFPNSKNLFLYRDAETWAQSMARLTRLLERGGLEKVSHQATISNYPSERLVSYARKVELPSKLSMLDSFALGWLSMMNRYLEHYQAGVPFAALRYKDLVQDPDAMLNILFDYCNLDKTEVSKAKKAFAKDSQAGTRFSGKANRKNEHLELQEEHLEQLRSMLRLHPELNQPDVVLPGTLLP